MQLAAPSVIVLETGASEADCAQVLAAAEDFLPGVRVTRGDGWAVVPLGDGVRPVESEPFDRFPSVRRLVQISAPYRLASRELFGRDMATEVPLRENGVREAEAVRFGGRASLGVIVSSRWASASESRLQLLAPLLREAGCRVFHAGQMALTANHGSPSELTEDALRGLRDVAHAHRLALSVEVSDASQIPSAVELADLLQVGSRNMQDFSLLREMGRVARLGVVVNDLRRSRRGWIGAWLMGHLLTANRYTRHDAPLSVRRAYEAPEVADMLRAAGLMPVRTVRGAFGQRYAIAAMPTPAPRAEDDEPPDPLGAEA